MTYELKDTFRRLREVAPELHSTLEQAGDQVAYLESLLGEQLQVGVRACGVEYDQSSFLRDDDIGRSSSYLAYERCGGRWRIVSVVEEFVQVDGVWRGIESTREATPWASCPMETKLRAFATLPSLLDALGVRIEHLLEQLPAATEVVVIFRAALGIMPADKGGAT